MKEKRKQKRAGLSHERAPEEVKAEQESKEVQSPLTAQENPANKIRRNGKVFPSSLTSGLSHHIISLFQ